MSIYHDRLRRWLMMPLSASLALGLAGCIVVQQPASIGPTTTVTAQAQSPKAAKPVAESTATPLKSQAVAFNNWADTVEDVRSGVAFIETSSCDSASTGTGFLVSGNLLITAAHVVDSATQIAVTLGQDQYLASILGFNATADIALLKIGGTDLGHQFRISSVEPRIGTRVAALGFPLASGANSLESTKNDFKFTEGSISGKHQNVSFDNISAQDVLQTDAAINPGNSGGPLIDESGIVLGMAFATKRGEFVEGTAYAVPASQINTAISEWRNAEPMALASCLNGGTESSVSEAPDFDVDSVHPNAGQIVVSFGYQGLKINQGQYDEAFQIFSPDMQARLQSSARWSSGLSTSEWIYLNVYDVEGQGDELNANVELWTLQDESEAPSGTDQWCSIWDNNYDLVRIDGVWRIDSVSSNADPSPCDEEMLWNELGIELTE